MAAEINIVSAVDEICAQVSLDAGLLLRLRSTARNNLAERKVLQTRLGSLDGDTLPEDEKHVREAAFSWILLRFDQAGEALKKINGPLAQLIHGELDLERGKHDQAIENLKAAAGQLSAEYRVEIELANAYRMAGKMEEAQAILDRLEGRGINDAELSFQKGRCLEHIGDYENSCVFYERALELDPDHSEAAFRLAYYLDLRGEDDKAIELYKKVTGLGPAFVNAKVNLALLLEDKEDVDGAIVALKEALRVDPTNQRAQLFLKDCIGSLDMYYDETERKESERLESILRIPCSDFELSVRSRNCLTKMNVRTLGDMVRKSEQELMAYKNFGETSLTEIKNLLESKGLRLGMFKDEDSKRARVNRLRSGAQDNPHIGKSIADLEFTVRSRKCMQRLNIETVADLLDRTEAELMAAKNFGQTSLNEIKAKLVELGLSLKTIG